MPETQKSLVYSNSDFKLQLDPNSDNLTEFTQNPIAQYLGVKAISMDEACSSIEKQVISYSDERDIEENERHL